MGGRGRREAEKTMKTWFNHRTHWSSALSGLLLILCAPSARAAPPASGARPATTANPAGGGGAGEEASNHFKRGLQLFDEGEYTLALVEFERAYQLAPNYRALYNIALVDMQLGRYADAARTLEQYLHDGGEGIAAARRAEVTKTLAELKLRTATVDISVNVPAAEVTLDGKPLDVSRLHGPMVIDAGEHTLRATAPGFQAANRTVTLAGADRAAVRLELAALAPQRAANEAPARPRSLFWPGFVATGALAAGGIVSGAIMLDARSHLSQLQNTPGSDPAQRESAANRQNSAALAADIFTGLAVVAGSISIYLSLGTDRAAKGPSVAVSPQRVALSVSF
jgi:tetratricopeptide (TPR) repeat protein